MCSSQWSQLVSWVSSFTLISQIPCRSWKASLSSPAYQTLTLITRASHAAPYNPAVLGAQGEGRGDLGSLLFCKEWEVRVPARWNNRSLFVFSCACFFLRGGGGGSAAGRWTWGWSHCYRCRLKHHYQQVTHTRLWEQLRYGLACIPMASHSKQKLKDLVNCCFFYFLFF